MCIRLCEHNLDGYIDGYGVDPLNYALSINRPRTHNSEMDIE